ncbi:hypothetical protein [Saccharothrix variisporea]|uniref:5-methylcytosine-specific restriction protein A n=1 Tax=Saccharothrix variisporea TaxID=543527 RepID=A0A495XNX3_9PSEU|nr:hypothetical protein [Saccharothrix variisporea]RKT73368.1 hypothetical protein DFJ66_6700 [Saccharothrix variisporea]
MTRLLIQPVRNREAKRNRVKTLHNDVVFSEPRFRSKLLDAERTALDRLHPDGRARFWGTRPYHDEAMKQVRQGDVALFVWDNNIGAIGEVGASFRNEAFAVELWKEPGDKDTFVNVYSLISLDDGLRIPYRELEEVSDGRLVGPFRQGRVVNDDVLVRRVLEGLGRRAAAVEEAAQQYVESQLERGMVVALEAHLTSEVTYGRTARDITVRRTESLLMSEYVEAHSDVEFKRIRSDSGISDMYTVRPEGAEVIEAKGGIARERVRQAVAQLLHYAPRCPDRVVRLTALFPARPDDGGVELLHSVGIDCVYRQEPGRFERLPAPAARRIHMEPVWNDDFPE